MTLFNMKLQNKSYIFLLLFFFIGCNAKKSVIEYKDRIQKDTIYTTKVIKEVERFTDTLTIESPCDSLGNLKPFLRTIKVQQGNYTLKTVNNVITAELDLKGYKDQLERTYQLKYDKLQESSTTEIIKYKIPLWVWIYIVSSAFIIFLLIRLK